MIVARLVGGALALLAMPNSTSAERANAAQTSLAEKAVVATYSAYAPACSGPCGFEALSFPR